VLVINLGGDATLDPLSNDDSLKTLRLRDAPDTPLRDFLEPDVLYNPTSECMFGSSLWHWPKS